LKRRLAVNADDFGFTRDVNEGIVEAHRSGILTSTTLMANGRAFEHAVGLARRHPALDIGCHLVLVGGESVAEPGRPLPATVLELLRGYFAERGRLRTELEAQIERILAAGLRPTHLDTHKHTHLFPPVLRAVAELGERYRIDWVRRPFDLPMTVAETPWTTRAVSRSLTLVRRRFHDTLAAHGLRTTDHFAGFQMTGRFGPEDLARLLRGLPEGMTEFMTHPGFCTDELRAARTRLKESRVRELEALTSPAVRRAIEDAQIELTPFSSLSRES
jgi:predicted glycoside hydrolase/deacetylase ChbG (UPF0249 family)